MKNINTSIVISGALGKMGKMLTKEAVKQKNIKLIYALIKEKHTRTHASYNKEKYSDKTIFFTTFKKLKKNKHALPFDTIIDFSKPNVTLKIIEYCIKNKKKIIIGTTGFTSMQMKTIKKASKIIPILYSPNFSIGINMMHTIIQYISKILGKNTDIEIIESHHRNKIDAPSGTALQLGKIISKSMNWKFSESAIFSRYGNVGKRKKNKIGFSVIREGNTIGKHTVLFANKYEKISVKHTATHRSIFAKGAIQAARWIHNKKKGLYSMNNVIKSILIS
ncbi:4-hydroxy-tetrahydrodipicolinate reductase [Buchnera aphidicola]|uniref:4-hydroxy-tetrahydrodipicolinate reductase n=1 Tax=Buchnera aphidicola (Cinara cf. splendens/pseudotsugae 3390) TaxID=2518980 RepID=A0A451CX16_9GAMM|nr:4-hydroxy-tetrahydrodipicolinate reductase [Buchnera aphidicola]VFP77668.1 4-hydroxy-tetrahydrodipicolinate reductase [Buchnera aphidicola (Cinara cf. splendens/pseudotsugae 3390)]